MRQWFFCLGLAMLGALGALVWAPHAATAQDASPLQGTFAWDSTAGDDVAGAVDAALADLSFLHRRFARGHLQDANRPYRTITIEQDEDTISIATDGGEPIRAPASGEPVEWTSGDGRRMRVSIVREDGRLRQTLVAEDEERENIFRPSADGRAMTMEVTVRVDRLPTRSVTSSPTGGSSKAGCATT